MQGIDENRCLVLTDVAVILAGDLAGGIRPMWAVWNLVSCRTVLM